jgi:hypothetical protein
MAEVHPIEYSGFPFYLQDVCTPHMCLGEACGVNSLTLVQNVGVGNNVLIKRSIPCLNSRANAMLSALCTPH